MNEDMPWVNLTQEEVDELRTKKHELTEYGKQKLKEMMTHEEMLEEAARREAENKALAALGELYKENGDAMTKLAEIEKEEREKLAAGFKQDADGNWYRPTLQDLTRNERIELAEKEIAYIVMGGQDGREYANSIAFILQVLDSLRDKESDFEDSADGVA
jgi:acyl-CoA reductase-like NAD-dependent aldehyde dehydrogenase